MLCHSCCSACPAPAHSLLTGPWPARACAHVSGAGARLLGQAARGYLCRQQKAAGAICSAGTVPRERCWSHPQPLTAPVDHHMLSTGNKAEPGRTWLCPGTCGSPWERQGRLVRFRAVITTLGTEKDYPSCAPFTEFSGASSCKTDAKRCHLFIVPMTVQDEEVKKVPVRESCHHPTQKQTRGCTVQGKGCCHRGLICSTVIFSSEIFTHSPAP